jgi:cysteine sulfinate desulfinase/cysteine desulfurase-like protein
MADRFFDNNANYPISSDTIECYDKGCKIGNVSCRTRLAEKGQLLINEFVKYLEDEFSGTADAHKYKAIITSGGSESNSTAIHNYVYQSVFINKMQPHFISSTVEHPSITDYLVRLEQDGVALVSWIKPHSNGEVPIDGIVSAIRPNTVCIFLQSVNSETGCQQNLASLWNHIMHISPRIRVHVDHVQGYHKINLPIGVADTISTSLHKIGAPLGIGVLLYRKSMNMIPLIAGKQNDGMRGGTYNIGAIAAASHVLQSFEMKPMGHYKKQFLSMLSKTYKILYYNHANPYQYMRESANSAVCVVYSDEKCLPHTIFMSIVINGETICGKVVKEILFRDGYTIGTGTACSANTEQTNAIGSMTSSAIPDELKYGFIRISFNNYIDGRALKRFAESFSTIPDVVKHIKQK